MAYFPHAYVKVLIGTHATNFLNGDGTLHTGNLAAGQLGLVNKATNKLIDITSAYTTPITVANFPLVYIAQGSFYTSDTYGPHGGYQESVKTKYINPKYVSKFYVTTPGAAKNQIVKVDGSTCAIECDTTYRLRIDVKGSPALRFLNHQIYKTLDAYSGCCDEDNNPIDVVTMFLQYADQITSSPILKDFVQPKVWVFSDTVTGDTGSTTWIDVANADKTKFTAGDKVTGSGVAPQTYVVSIGADDSGGSGQARIVVSKATTASATGVTLTIWDEATTAGYTPVTGSGASPINAHMDLIGAYVDTTFGDCSFNPKDHFEREPIQIYASFVDESGDPCVVNCLTVTETQAPLQGKGYGETILRELILSNSYRQDYWNDDVRIREITGDTSLASITRGNTYYVYHILHSVPRKANPSGIMDNDQYLVKLVVSARNSDFETVMDLLLADAKSGVALEVL